MTEKKKRFFESMYEILDRENGRKLQMYGIIDLLNEQDEKIKELEKENEQLKKRVDKLKVIMAEFGATLLMNGFDIEVDGKDLMEMINNE